MYINFRKTTFWGVAADIASCPASDRPEVVLSGKSNVGKSALVNALADNKKLARVSQSPGKTRLVIYFDVDQKLYLADLPGYGYAKASKETKEKFSKLVDQYFSSGRPFSLVLHLIDIRHAPSKEDVQMMQYMRDQKIPFFLVFTKCDKFSRQARQKRLQEQLQALDIAEEVPCFAVSSEKKEGLLDLQQGIEQFLFPEHTVV